MSKTITPMVAPDSRHPVVKDAEVALIQRYCGEKVVWVGGVDDSLRQRLEVAIPSIRIARRPADVTCESIEYDTLVLAPSFGCQIGPQAFQLLCELVLRPGGNIILPDIHDVTRILKQLGDGVYSPEIIGPYSLLNENTHLNALLKEAREDVSIGLERVLSDPDAVNFWSWLEGSLHSILPPWLSSRSLVVMSANGSVQGCVDTWERYDQLPLLDMSAFQFLLGENFEEFQAGIAQRVSKMGVFDLIAKLSDVFECRLSKKIDFFTLLTDKQRSEIAERVAWYWADGAHKPLVCEGLNIDGVFLPKELDFMLYDKFIKVVAQIKEQYP